MKEPLYAIGAFFAVIFFFSGSSNRDFLETKAVEKWKENGFKVVAYEGYTFGLRPSPWSTYGGAKVWHRLEKIPDNGVTYSGSLQRWGSEVHVYGPEAVEAISPRH